MDFLPQQNRRVAGDSLATREILATDRHVVILGGGFGLRPTVPPVPDRSRATCF